MGFSAYDKNKLDQVTIVTKLNKDEAKRQKQSYNYFLIVSVIALVVGVLSSTLLLMLSTNYWTHVLGIDLLLIGIVLLTHEERDNLLRLALVLLASGLTFLVLALSNVYYLGTLFLAIPVILMIKNRSSKHMILPTIFFVGLATYLFIQVDSYFLTWISLLPLIYFYYKTRYKVRAKATYLHEPSAYEQRKQKDKQRKNF